MMIVYSPYIMANRRGIPRIEATGYTESSTALTFTFNNRGTPINDYNGLILFKIPNFTAPADAVAVVFDSLPVEGFDGTALTTTDFTKGGIYLAFYDGSSFKILSNY